VVVLSAYTEEAYALELLGEDAAGVGYLLKDRVSDGDRFAEAVRRVAEGGSALDPEVVSHMLGRRRVQQPLEDLTPREHEVLLLVAGGLANAEIARRLCLAEQTVKSHVSSVLFKLKLRDRVQAVILAYEAGLVIPGGADGAPAVARKDEGGLARRDEGDRARSSRPGRQPHTRG